MSPHTNSASGFLTSRLVQHIISMTTKTLHRVRYYILSGLVQIAGTQIVETFGHRRKCVTLNVRSPGAEEWKSYKATACGVVGVTWK